MYKVIITPKATKAVESLPLKIQAQFFRKIDFLSKNPYLPSVKKIRGSDTLLRERMGNYRIVFEIKNQELVIIVVRIAHRREVYQGL